MRERLSTHIKCIDCGGNLVRHTNDLTFDDIEKAVDEHECDQTIDESLETV